MSPRWEDLNARARGLSGHLLRWSDLDALAAASDLSALAEGLARRGMPPGEAPGAEGIELGIRRWGAAALQILGRWVGERRAALPLVFDEEDRRSLRALVRGAVAGVPAARRLSGLLPTPGLPERALETLAAAPEVTAIGAHLVVWRHPFAGAVPTTITGAPDLYAIEAAIGRRAETLAAEAARRSGSRALRQAVAEGLELERVVLAAAAARDATEGARRPLDVSRFHGTPYARAITEHAADPVRLATELLRLRIERLRHEVRRAPLEPTVTLLIALRLRAQMLDLQRIIWAVALGAPRAPLRERWTSVAA